MAKKLTDAIDDGNRKVYSAALSENDIALLSRALGAHASNTRRVAKQCSTDLWYANYTREAENADRLRTELDRLRGV